MKYASVLLALVAAALIAAGCSARANVPTAPPGQEPAGEPRDRAPAASPTEPPHAVQAGEQALAGALHMPAAEVELVSFRQVQWPNACLGLPEQGEVCAQVLVPGWRVTLSVDGQRYEVRTDDSGDTVRWQALENE